MNYVIFHKKDALGGLRTGAKSARRPNGRLKMGSIYTALFAAILIAAALFIGKADAVSLIPIYGYIDATGTSYVFNNPTFATSDVEYYYNNEYPSTSTYWGTSSHSPEQWTYYPIGAFPTTTESHFFWVGLRDPSLSTWATHYFELYWNATSSVWEEAMENDPVNCNNVTIAQLCIAQYGDVCTWNYSSSTCVFKSQMPCTPYACNYCLNETDCEAQSPYCQWSAATGSIVNFWDKFKTVIGLLPATTTFPDECITKRDIFTEGTTTDTHNGYGMLRTAFHDRIPFAYFFEVQDIMNGLYSASGTNATSIPELTIHVPTDLGVSSTLMGSSTVAAFDIPLVDRTFFFGLMSENSWHTIRDLLGLGCYVVLLFYFYRKIRTIISMHT